MNNTIRSSRDVILRTAEWARARVFYQKKLGVVSGKST